MMCPKKNLGLAIIRISLGAIFVTAGVMKIMAASTMIAMVGGAAHQIGLTFLPVAVWGWLATIGELVAGLLLIAGLFVPVASALIIIIMFVAFASMGFNMQTGMVTVICATTALGLGFTGPGMWSVKGLLCKKCTQGSACCPTTGAPMTK